MCSGNGYIMPHSGDHPCDEKLSVPGWEVTQWDSSLLCRAPGLMSSPKRTNLAISSYLRKFQLLIKVILIFDILWGKSESMLSLKMHSLRRVSVCLCIHTNMLVCVCACVFELCTCISVHVEARDRSLLPLLLSTLFLAATFF